MPTLLFTLTLDEIFFENRLPRYPSLIDYDLSEGLQLEPALKVRSDEDPAGPFEVVFKLDSNQSTRFIVEEGSFPLKTIAGDAIGASSWSATAANEGLEVTLLWDSASPPPTQVLRLDCTPDPENEHPQYLFFVFVQATELSSRTVSGEPMPQIPTSPKVFELVEDNGKVVYAVILSSARDDPHPDFEFELALRVPEGHELQFAIDLDESTDLEFGGSRGGQDEVSVTVYGGGNSDALLPTLRPSAQRCIVTWDAVHETPPADHFLAFNLETEPATTQENASTRARSAPPVIRRVDPTIIVDPLLIPPSEDP